MIEINRFREILKDGSLFEEIQESLSDFTSDLLSSLYPSSIIKRIVYRPLIGRWFPNFEVVNQGLSNQMAFFFGDVNMCFSEERYCAFCGLRMLTTPTVLNFISISVCDDCSNKIYREYWHCLDSIQHSCMKEIDKKSQCSCSEVSTCDDFFNPRCGYQSISETINPCLKDHAIGLLLMDAHNVMILIGRKDLLKYRMIWTGGIIGIILGLSNQIMNLAILKKLLPKIYKTINDQANSYNNQYGNSGIQIIYVSYQLNDNLIKDSWFFGFFYAFLSYYSSHAIRSYFNRFFSKPLEWLKMVIRELFSRCNLEILDYIELCDIYPPIDFSLRELLEDHFKELMDSRHHGGGSFLECIKGLDLNFLTQRELIQDFFHNLEEFPHELKLEKILWSMGPYMLIKSGNHRKPIIINIKELIGRIFY